MILPRHTAATPRHRMGVWRTPPAAPTPQAAAVGVTGLTLATTYSEAIVAVGVGADGFAATASGGAVAVTAAAIAGGIVVLTLSRAVLKSETVSLAYTPGVVTGVGGGNGLAFSGFNVANNSTVLF